MNTAPRVAEPIAGGGEFPRVLRERGYRPDGEPFEIGRPDRTTIPLLDDSERRVVAKIYSDGSGEHCFADMRELWRSSFGERRDPPGLPRPIEYLSEHRILVLERVAGRPMAESGDPDAGAVQHAVRLAAELHGSDARPARRRSARGIFRSLGRKAQRISRLDPALGAAALRVADTLEESRTKWRGLVPGHGDFSPRNVLVVTERSVLIDWDRFQLTDPARDVAYFGAWCWVSRLRRGDTTSWSVLEDAAAAYAALRPDADVASRLDFHVAAGLVRIAEGLLTLWKEDAHLARRVLEEALSRAKEAA